MLTRIVRMQFKGEHVLEFEKIFNETYKYIRNFKGCRFLQLYKDQTDLNTYYTISKWENEGDLEKYRESELFVGTWARTKKLFSAPAEAFSLNKEVEDATNPF